MILGLECTAHGKSLALMDLHIYNAYLCDLIFGMTEIVTKQKHKTRIL